MYLALVYVLLKQIKSLVVDLCVCEGLPTGEQNLVHMCMDLCSRLIYEVNICACKLFGFVCLHMCVVLCVCLREGVFLSWPILFLVEALH